jgi:hypothetical protein
MGPIQNLNQANQNHSYVVLNRLYKNLHFEQSSHKI